MLSVLDGAVLVISAVEGVQAQTRVLMRTLQRLRIPTLHLREQDRPRRRAIRTRAAGHRREADAGDHPDGIGARPRHPQRSLHAVRRGRPRFHGQAGRAARRPRRCASGRVRRRRDDGLLPPAPRGARGADQAGAGASGVLRLGDHRRGRRAADRRRSRSCCPRPSGDRRRPGFGHASSRSSAARPGRRSRTSACSPERVRTRDRLQFGRGQRRRRSPRSASSTAARPSSARRSPRGRSASSGVSATSRSATRSAARERPRSATTSPRRRWRRSSFPAAPPTKARSTPRSPSSPSRTR